jgi:hypothetical protein
MYKLNLYIIIPVLISVLSSECFAGNPLGNTPIADMFCRLSTKQTETCSSTLVLVNGELQIFGNRRFELLGHYNACFHIEDVTIKGTYQLLNLDDAWHLELLGEQLNDQRGKIKDFPRTIGRVDLNKSTLKGVFIDIWAVIRNQSTDQILPSSIELTCQLI